MEDEIEIRKLEKVAINLCTPVLYALTPWTTWKGIVRDKKLAYKRLIRHVEKKERIHPLVCSLYHITPCGNLMIGAAYARKYFRGKDAAQSAD